MREADGAKGEALKDSEEPLVGGAGAGALASSDSASARCNCHSLASMPMASRSSALGSPLSLCMAAPPSPRSASALSSGGWPAASSGGCAPSLWASPPLLITSRSSPAAASGSMAGPQTRAAFVAARTSQSSPRLRRHGYYLSESCISKRKFWRRSILTKQQAQVVGLK